MYSGAGDHALSELRLRVNQIVRQADGRDNPSVREFSRVADAAEASAAEARARIRRISEVLDFVPNIATSSRVPGGSLVHSAIARATRRETQALLDQTRRLAQEVTDALLEALDEADLAPGNALSRICAQIEMVADVGESLSTEVSRLTSRVAALDARIDELVATTRSREFNPWFSSQDFNDEFRGGREMMLLRYADVAKELSSTGGPVLDLGCGRGELLELLASMGTEAWGADIDLELVDYCRSILLDVRLCDARSALESVEDSSLGGIALIQVVEHLRPQDLVELVPVMRRKVRTGGIVVAETPNPNSSYTLTHAFYLDPTHRNPIPADYLRFLFDRAGFSETRIHFGSPVPESDRIRLVASADSSADFVEQVNAGFDRLNRALFGAQDYAVIAVR
jgi:SAM-dependent methyltransferase